MSALILGYVVFRLARFVFVTGRWDIVRANLKAFMVGRYPTDELWRISLAVVLIAAYGGLVAGVIHRRQVLAGHGRTVRIVARQALRSRRSAVAVARRRRSPASLTSTIGPWLAPAPR